MSPTATASEPPAGRRRAWAPRWLVITHRYLGISVGVMMLMWCLSGVVMLFVPYPRVDEAARLAALPRIDWSRCCTFGSAVDPQARVEAATVESLAGAPVLRVSLADGGRRTIELSTGAELGEVSATVARVVAAEGRSAPVAGVAAVARDQWTVSGEFNRARPFWRVRLGDRAGTEVYVSRRTGQVAQQTTAASRALNWVGAAPHWLYPAILRQHPRAWAQVVNWTALVGVFLTLTGLYLGLMAWRPFGDRRLSPFRGLMTWHHLAGLATGVLTLTWVASGLVSMNPWGFLESPSDPAVARLAGDAPSLAQVQAALAAVAARGPTAAQVRAAPLGGELFVRVGDQRLDARGAPAPLTGQGLAAAGRRLGAVASQGMISRGDTYYFSHHEPVQLPAWRVVRTDGARFYLDPSSGELVASADRAGRAYRWLHLGLHRLDFVPGLDRGPGWAAAMVVLLAAVSFGVGTGVWLAWRRAGADLGRLRRRRPDR